MVQQDGLEALIRALARPGVLPGSGEQPPQVVQTHISVVFLAGDRAFKLKKPVDFGFLDFSTRERRARYTHEELRLNRRLAPDIYLGLAPVWIRDGETVEVGDPVEQPTPCDELLVTMVRLPQARMMDRLLAEGAVTARQVERLARLVATFHRRAETGDEVDRYGRPDAVATVALENFTQTEGFCGSLFDAAAHRRMQARTRAFLDAHEKLLTRRVERGRIREGHGDLHSPNICFLEDDRPVVYDCIEFSAAYRCLDVASEIGFLAMDLDFRGAPELADRFVETYLAESEDDGAEALLPFYRSYRAMVRAKIAALTAAAPEVDPDLRERSTAEARQLFELADRYTEGLVPPSLVVLSGLPGSLRRPVARQLRRWAGLVPERGEDVGRQLSGADAGELPPPDDPLRSEGRRAATYRALARQAERRLEAGESALVTGPFAEAGPRAALRDVAASLRVPFRLVRLHAREEVALERIAAYRGGREAADAETLSELERSHRPPDELPENEVLVLDTSDAEAEPLARHVLAWLREGPGGSKPR
jgi:hypothetical protein